MLTNNDLNKIQTIVQTETRKIIHSEVPLIVQTETNKIIQRELKPIKEDITKIRKDMKTVVNFFDEEYLELRKRVEKIEQFLNLTTA